MRGRDRESVDLELFSDKYESLFNICKAMIAYGFNSKEYVNNLKM